MLQREELLIMFDNIAVNITVPVAAFDVVPRDLVASETSWVVADAVLDWLWRTQFPEESWNPELQDAHLDGSEGLQLIQFETEHFDTLSVITLFTAFWTFEIWEAI